MSSERTGVTQSTGNETTHSATKESQNTGSNPGNRVSGTTGTGIASGETGYGESGQLPDPAAPPISQSNNQ